MKESLYDVLSDQYGHIAFDRVTGMSKSKQSRAFLKACHKVSERDGNDVFTEKDFRDIAEALHLKIDNFGHFLDSLNQQNFILVSSLRHITVALHTMDIAPCSSHRFLSLLFTSSFDRNEGPRNTFCSRPAWAESLFRSRGAHSTCRRCSSFFFCESQTRQDDAGEGAWAESRKGRKEQQRNRHILQRTCLTSRMHPPGKADSVVAAVRGGVVMCVRVESSCVTLVSG